MLINYKYVYIAYDERALKELVNVAQRFKKRRAIKGVREAFDFAYCSKGLCIFTTGEIDKVPDTKMYTFQVEAYGW